MISFTVFKEAMSRHIDTMLKGNLFIVNADKLWELYLSSFSPDANKIFRERREHDCSACRNFIKSFGNVVSVREGVITTIWSFDIGEQYAPVVKALDAYVRSCDVVDVYMSKVSDVGVDKNYEKTDSGVMIWDHLYVKLPTNFVSKNRDATLRDVHNVFQRSLETITEDSILCVLELIASNSLYKGEEWKSVLEKFLAHKQAYSKLDSVVRNLYAWEHFQAAGPIVGKIRNHSIGTLLIDISEGMELDVAVRKYEAIVAPSNYKRPKAIFTRKMLLEAEAKITELGYLTSLDRRFATLDDITVNNILFADRDTKIKGTIFDSLDPGICVKSFERLETVTMDTFVSEILPSVHSVQMLLENKHASNLVSLIAPKHDAKTMFKWDNNFSWAYSGNITDSMKQRVKALGGNVTGVLRFSIQWNDQDDNFDDLDAHCIEPNWNKIYFGARVHPSSGVLDVDIINPSGVAVENITWSNVTKMPVGKYEFFVHCYSSRGAKSGFTAEIEFEGQIYLFSYNKPLRHDQKVQVAEVTKSQGSGSQSHGSGSKPLFSIKEIIPSQLASCKLWNLDTQHFHPVSVIMMSPNYWDEKGVGNRHYFFMLKGCINSEQPSGFFNEYLNNDLLPHKHVFEALGNKMRVEESEEQLSGVGFSSTQHNELVVKVSGSVNRMLKIMI